jgi:hypothetical protein
MLSNIRLNGLRIRSKALPVVAAAINGIALRIADMAEFKPRGVDGQILVELFVLTPDSPDVCLFVTVSYRNK